MEAMRGKRPTETYELQKHSGVPAAPDNYAYGPSKQRILVTWPELAAWEEPRYDEVQAVSTVLIKRAGGKTCHQIRCQLNCDEARGT